MWLRHNPFIGTIHQDAFRLSLLPLECNCARVIQMNRESNVTFDCVFQIGEAIPCREMDYSPVSLKLSLAPHSIFLSFFLLLNIYGSFSLIRSFCLLLHNVWNLTFIPHLFTSFSLLLINSNFSWCFSSYFNCFRSLLLQHLAMSGLTFL